MNTQVKVASTATDAARYGEQYAYAVLHADFLDQQGQIEFLTTEINEIKKKYVTPTNMTKVIPFNVHVAYLPEQFRTQRVIQHPQSFSQFTNVDYLSSEGYVLKTDWGREENSVFEAKTENTVTTVPLHSLLKFAGAMMGATAIASIAFWITGQPPIYNPFISVMMLVASPFAYAMGVAANRR